MFRPADSVIEYVPSATEIIPLDPSPEIDVEVLVGPLTEKFQFVDASSGATFFTIDKFALLSWTTIQSEGSELG